MGVKSTLNLGRLKALHIIADKLGVERASDISKQIEYILEKVTDYNNEDSEYYFVNFHVSGKYEKNKD